MSAIKDKDTAVQNLKATFKLFTHSIHRGRKGGMVLGLNHWPLIGVDSVSQEILAISGNLFSHNLEKGSATVFRGPLHSPPHTQLSISQCQ